MINDKLLPIEADREQLRQYQERFRGPKSSVEKLIDLRHLVRASALTMEEIEQALTKIIES